MPHWLPLFRANVLELGSVKRKKREKTYSAVGYLPGQNPVQNQNTTNT